MKKLVHSLTCLSEATKISHTHRFSNWIRIYFLSFPRGTRKSVKVKMCTTIFVFVLADGVLLFFWLPHEKKNGDNLWCSRTNVTLRLFNWYEISSRLELRKKVQQEFFLFIALSSFYQNKKHSFSRHSLLILISPNFF